MQVWMSFRESKSTLRCAGEIDLIGEEKLRTAITMVMRTDPLVLHLDLSMVSFLGLGGAEVVLEAAKTCRELGIVVRLTPSPAVRRVFDLIGWGLIERETPDDYDLPQELESALTKAFR